MAPSSSALSRRGFLTASGTFGATVGLGRAETTTASSAANAPEPRWTVTGSSSESFYPIALVEGTVYALGIFDSSGNEKRRSKVYALDAENGDEQWSFDLPSLPTIPEIVDGTLYVGADIGSAEPGDRRTLLALDTQSGDELWRKQTSAYFFDGPIIADGKVILQHKSGLVALDVETGDQKWRYDSDDHRFDRVVSAEKTVYVGASEGIYAISTADGTEKWRRDPRESIFERAMHVTDEHVYCMNDDDLFALDATDGTTVWRTSVRSFAEFLFEDGTIYLWENDRLRAIDPRDGIPRWTYGEDVMQGVNPIIVDGTLFAGSRGGVFHAVDVTDGSKRWSFAPQHRSGFDRFWGGVRDGIAYVTADDRLYALSADDGAVEWSFEPDEQTTFTVVGEEHLVLGTQNAIYGFDRQRSFLTAFVDDTTDFLTSGVGLALSGVVVGTGAFVAYRRLNRDEEFAPESEHEPEPELEYGRLERVAGDEITETYRVRKRTDDGPRVVWERRLTDSNLQEAFRESVARWAELSDRRGVVPVLDYGDDWVELPNYEGGSLADCDRPLAERIDALSEASMTIHGVHADGLVHGALTPESILLDDAEVAHVSDWGFDALAEHRDPSPYDAPEQTADGAVDERTDVYRLGAIAHFVVTGEAPADAPPHDIDPTLSRAMADALSTALADDPDDRYQSVVKFDDVLRWAAFRA
ncbi:outer membrane protein assembly factor BamB family protein [Haladaptatus sp. NG-SE-30]